MRGVSTTQAVRLLDIPKRTLHRWLGRGDGIGHPRRLAIVPELLALAVARHLRASGYTTKTCGDVLRVLMRYDEDTLREAFDEGRTCLAIVGATVFGRLVARESVVSNPLVDYHAHREAGLMPAGIDVEVARECLLKKLAERAEEENMQPARCR